MIKNVFKRIKKFLSWGIYQSIPDSDLIEKQRYKLFFTFSFMCFLLCIVESFHAMSFEISGTILMIGLQTFAAIFLVNYLWLQRHQNLRLAYLVCLMTAFACVHLFNYYYGGIRNSGNFYYLFMIIATVILLGNRQGWIMLGLSVINQVYFYQIGVEGGIVQNVLAANESELNQDFLLSTFLAVIAIAALSNNLGSSKNIIIEKIKESQRTLSIKNKELRKLSLVASKTDSAVMITDPQFRITWVNEAFTRLTGYDSTEVKGKNPAEFLIGTVSDADTVGQMKANMETRKPFVGELEQYHKDGHLFWGQLSVTPILNVDGTTKEYIMLQDDITQRKHAEQKIRNYLRELEITNRELDKFAYVVSHDLKAPLHAISNLTGWIEEDMSGKFSEETNSNFNIIKNRVARMEDLINGLLEFARANYQKGVRTSVDLNQFINEVIEFCSIPENCTIAMPGTLPVVFGDKIKFQQIFANLIVNAIKYNDKPEIHIVISAQEHENDWLISVRDNGPGIDPRFHEKIFVIFQTLNPRDTVESTGVGLAIVKKIIEEEGGSIFVESESGKGADFRFTWPKEQKNVAYRYQGSLANQSS